MLTSLLSSLGCKLGVEDFLVLELLRWFKHSFFSWVNCLPCSRCGGSTQNQGSLSPSSEDLRWGAQRVEKHFCQSCQLSTRFPRFLLLFSLVPSRPGSQDQVFEQDSEGQVLLSLQVQPP